MAELSAETQAIVERLQAEGKLLRNTGSNSIRSVKVELSKFEGIFNTISNNITSQTETMRASMGAQADIAEREREQAARQRAFDDLEQDSESAELKALRDKVETQKLKNDLASEKDKAKGDGLFKKLSGLGGLKILGGGLLAVGALAIGKDTTDSYPIRKCIKTRKPRGTGKGSGGCSSCRSWYWCFSQIRTIFN